MPGIVPKVISLYPLGPSASMLFPAKLPGLVRKARSANPNRFNAALRSSNIKSDYIKQPIATCASLQFR